jgi:hypothetical protein
MHLTVLAHPARVCPLADTTENASAAATLRTVITEAVGRPRQRAETALRHIAPPGASDEDVAQLTEMVEPATPMTVE